MAEIVVGIAVGFIAFVGGMEPLAAFVFGGVAAGLLFQLDRLKNEVTGLRARVADLEVGPDDRTVASTEPALTAPPAATPPAVSVPPAPAPAWAPTSPAVAAASVAPAVTTVPSERPVWGPVAATPVAPATPTGWVTPSKAPAGPSWIDEAVASIARSIGPKGRSREEIEAWIGGRLLAIVGGLALVLGALFFLSLAFSRGWIGPELRVAIGYLAGGALLAGAIWLLDRRFVLLGHILVAVGLAVTSLASFAGTQLFGLFTVEIGLVVSGALAVVSAWIALRADSQAVALLGVAALLGAPPLLGASPDVVTLVFVAASLVGMMVLALRKGWPWLPVLGFVLTVPQVAAYVSADPPVAVGVVVISAFAALIAAAAHGTAAAARERLTMWVAVGLLAANAIALLAFGDALIGRDEPLLLGSFLAVAAIAHLGLAGLSFARRGADDAFAIATATVGIAGLALALPITFDGPIVAAGWAALAVVLTLIADRRAHLPAAVGAAILGALSIVHVVTVEYGIGSLWDVDGPPFVDQAGAGLAALLIAAAVVIVIVDRRWVRSLLVAFMALLVGYGCWFEADFMGILFAWTALALVALQAQIVLFGGRWPPIPDRPLVLLDWSSLAAAAALACLSVAQYVMAFAPIDAFMDGVIGVGAVLPPRPFTDEATLGALLLMAAGLAAGWIIGLPIALRIGAAFAAGVAAYLLPFELAPWLVAVGWAAIGALGMVAAHRDVIGRAIYAVEGATILGAAALVSIAVVAPPSRLAVDATASLIHPFLVSEATAALGACALALGVVAWVWRDDRRAVNVALGAVALGVYLLSVGIVDWFQGKVGTGPFTVEELQKQAQVALSVLWLVIGMIAFVVGLRRGIAVVRLVGLALLGLATVKVFLFDLAFLDVAYRVLSFVALGLLLLASAFAYQRMRPRPGAPPVQ